MLIDAQNLHFLDHDSGNNPIPGSDEKINGFLGDFVRIGDKLSDANVSYDNAYNKLSEGRGSMVRQAEMLKKLGLKTTRSIPREFKKSIEDPSE